MAGISPENKDGSERALDQRLDDMNKRLGRDIHAKPEPEPSKTKNEGFGNAFKLSSEFISAILVGTAIGYGIDWLVGTTPFAMIGFLLLGFVAGVMNVLRASGEMAGSYELSSSKPDSNLGKDD